MERREIVELERRAERGEWAARQRARCCPQQQMIRTSADFPGTGCA
ncbi:hypothetical protein PJ985_00700 [Streptomyces sp. ACA25]|nr:hypothetical protein [Streptomyces sp. ACA25]MDB1086099.1 hypothetical protein [Streptomyces sp. ACA25]